jgi:hypothetical protein
MFMNPLQMTPVITLLVLYQSFIALCSSYCVTDGESNQRQHNMGYGVLPVVEVLANEVEDLNSSKLVNTSFAMKELQKLLKSGLSQSSSTSLGAAFKQKNLRVLPRLPVEHGSVCVY